MLRGGLNATGVADTLGLRWVRTGPRTTSTVLLIHPVSFDLTYWDAQIDALRPAYDVIAFDLPGHGSSGGGPHDCSFERNVDAVASLIDIAATGPVHLIGISFGGMIAQATVLAHPERVRTLTLIGTAASFPESVRNVMRERAQLTRQGGMAAVLDSSLKRWFTPETVRERPHLIDRVSKTVLAGDPAIHAAVWDAIADFDVHDRLHTIHCPTLVLVGDRDPSTPPAAATILKNGIQGAEMVVLSDTSHIAMLESPDAVNAELLRFLAVH